MSKFDRLRAALEAEMAEAGAITRDEVQAVLDAHPADQPAAEGRFSDTRFDPARFE